MAAIPSIKLNTGASIPAIGLGGGPSDFTLDAMAASEKWLLTGFQAGYRHFDTAVLYGTERYLGAALRTSGVKRDEVFITTKLPSHHQVYIDRSFNESLSNLGLDYVDLYLLHWPQTLEYPGGYHAPMSLQDLFTTFKLLDTGRARAIGVSNFSIKTLEELSKDCARSEPGRLHPYLVQTELVEYCRKKGIVVAAYTPTGRDTVRNDPVIVALAAKYKATTTQLILAWHLARGVVALPGSTNAERQKQNLELPTLSTEDVDSITALDRGERTVMGRLGTDGKLAGWTAEQLGW